jgi:hypothetical protein
MDSLTRRTTLASAARELVSFRVAVVYADNVKPYPIKAEEYDIPLVWSL